MAAIAPPLIRPSAPMSTSSPNLSSIARPTSIQRRSTLKRSRDDSSIMNPPSSPSKRSKVTFSPEVEVVLADDDDDEIDPLLVREQVRIAIQRHLVSDDDSYERIIAIFKKDPRSETAPSAAVVKVHLQALLANVSSLDKRCNGLVNAALFGEWVGRDEEYCALYSRFIINLAAAQSGYLGRTIFALVDLLGPQKMRRLSKHGVVRQSLIHFRAMHIIRRIVERVPVASSTLVQVIQKKLSMDYEKPDERVIFTKNFMDLIGLIPEVKSEVLAMITSELVKLDVSVQVDLEDDDDDISDALLQDVSSSQTLVADASQMSLQSKHVEDDDGSTTEESDLEDDDILDSEELRRQKLRDNIRQVDALMDLLFRYYDDLISSSLEVRENTISQIVAHFKEIILPTYRSRHSQFIIFHFAQTSPVTVDRFVTSCISILIEKKLPPVLRQSAAAYLAGFVGRGAHVSPQVVRDCFTMLCDELNDLRTDIEPRCNGPDLIRHSTFYAMMQAVMYIFCFRWRDLATTSYDMDDESDDEDQPEQYYFSDSIRDTLSSAVHSALNPLRVCTPGIVEQFAKICHHLRFMYLFTKIEANKHVRLAATRNRNSDLSMNQPDRDISWIGESGVMEGCFPYDPYQLPISKRWLESDYIEWQGIPGENEDGSDSEDAEEDDDMIDEDAKEDDETATEENVE